METLSLLFFIIALFYSMAGFGGGSSYTALLMVSGLLHYSDIPLISLICNLAVVTGSLYHFKKHQNLELKFISPFLITSIPFTYLGTQVNISKEIFVIILGSALLLAAIKILFYKQKIYSQIHTPQRVAMLSIGAILGFTSGLVGIGGGIFLAPILYSLKWHRPKVIASCATIFIFVNSIIGVIGHLYKNSFILPEGTLLLLLSVLLGGQIGNYLCNTKLKPINVMKVTGILILMVSIRLLFFTV